MAAITTKHFDILDFIKKSKALGVDERVAELQARQIEQLVETVQEQQQEYTTRLNALEAKEPSTKKDLEVVKLELQKEIIETKGSLQKELEMLRAEIKTDLKNLEIKILTLYGAGFLILLGVLAKGFHWF